MPGALTAWQVHAMVEPGVHGVELVEVDAVVLDELELELELEPPPPVGSTIVDPQPARSERASNVEAQAIFIERSYHPSSAARRATLPRASTTRTGTFRTPSLAARGSCHVGSSRAPRVPVCQSRYRRRA